MKLPKKHICNFYILFNFQVWRITHCWISTAGWIQWYKGYTIKNNRKKYSTFSPYEIKLPEKESDLP